MNVPKTFSFMCHNDGTHLNASVSLLMPVPMAARSKSHSVFDLLNTRIVGSNPALVMDVCPHFSVLCCPV